MADWNKRGITCSGSVFFRGTLPPRLENFTQLAAQGVSVVPEKRGPKFHWAAKLRHDMWGTATLLCGREFLPIPAPLIKFDPRMTPRDAENAALAGSAVSVTLEGSPKSVLRDRKTLLRFLNLLMGDDGLIAADHTAEKFWTKEILDEELLHDADVDIESLFVTHAVTEEKVGDAKPRVTWLHTHGLAPLGAPDFDVLRPSPDLHGRGYDTIRALAYWLLERGPAAAGQQVKLWSPGGPATLTPVEEFNRRASSADRAIRGDPSDPVHNTNRVILCDLAQKRLFGLLPGRAMPSRTLTTFSGDRMMAYFPKAATELMAERARKTYGVFRRFIAEFAEFGVKPIVKLGYVIDGGGTDEKEHMWFEVKEAGTGDIVATLANKPLRIQRMQAGQTGRHSLETLTDWMILTPVGSINPRYMTAARVMRQNADAIRAAMAKQHATPG
jgi:uncharacterized protein YegJ (DUF2314 family)